MRLATSRRVWRSVWTGCSAPFWTTSRRNTATTTSPARSASAAARRSQLAGFFGVPASYFFDDDDAVRIEEELELLAALRSAGVHQVAMRASGLSKAAISAIVDMIDIARRLEGLPEAHPEV
jgi:hypothetical protein